MPSEVFWRDLKYIQRDVEDKQKFSDNWDLIFKKNKEQPNANNENNNEKREDRL
jgi:hypothetical protein